MSTIRSRLIMFVGQLAIVVALPWTNSPLSAVAPAVQLAAPSNTGTSAPTQFPAVDNLEAAFKLPSLSSYVTTAGQKGHTGAPQHAVMPYMPHHASVTPTTPPDPVPPAIDFADPAVTLLPDGQYYAFGNYLARVATGTIGEELSAWSEPWTFLSRSPVWSTCHDGPPECVGAPSPPVLLDDGRLIITFQAEPNGTCKQDVCRCLGVAYANLTSNPIFTPTTEPLTCAEDQNGAIDSSLRWWEPEQGAGEQRQLLMYYKTTGFNSLERPAMLNVQRLLPDGSALVGERIVLLNQSERWEAQDGIGCIEAPAMQILEDGKSRLFYSGGDWTAGLESKTPYSIGVGLCNTPLGPCKKATTDKRGGAWFGPKYVAGNETVVGPGSQEVFRDARGAWWMVYHGWAEGKAGYDRGGERAMRMYPLSKMPDLNDLV